MIYLNITEADEICVTKVRVVPLKMKVNVLERLHKMKALKRTAKPHDPCSQVVYGLVV